jgi:hypothetical protein
LLRATAIEPVKLIDCVSVRGVQFTPKFDVLKIPPPAVATYQTLGCDSGVAMPSSRPPVACPPSISGPGAHRRPVGRRKRDRRRPMQATFERLKVKRAGNQSSEARSSYRSVCSAKHVVSPPARSGDSGGAVYPMRRDSPREFRAARASPRHCDHKGEAHQAPHAWFCFWFLRIREPAPSWSVPTPYCRTRLNGVGLFRASRNFQPRVTTVSHFTFFNRRHRSRSAVAEVIARASACVETLEDRRLLSRPTVLSWT